MIAVYRENDARWNWFAFLGEALSCDVSSMFIGADSLYSPKGSFHTRSSFLLEIVFP